MLQTLTKVETIAVGLGAASSLVALIGWGIDPALGVFAGAFVGVANFHVMRVLMGKMLLDDRSDASRAALAAIGGFKLLLLIGVIGLFISVFKVDAWAFFLGTVTLVVAIVAAVFMSGLHLPSDSTTVTEPSVEAGNSSGEV